MLLSQSSLRRLSGAGQVLCAVSGGADSMCLLHQLYLLAQEKGFALTALHYNHGLRPSADAEERFVRDWCREKGIAFRSEKGDVAAYAREKHLSTETAARELRYAFFEREARACGAEIVATAHNADDNLETVLMHLLRGSGLRGLCGIPESRGLYLRPLLDVTREEIERYLQQAGVPHVEDESNFAPLYTRNRLRLEVIPLLRTFNPNLSKTVREAGRSLLADERCLSDAAEKLCTRVDRGERETVFPLSLLRQVPEPVAARALRREAERLGFPLSLRQTESVLALREKRAAALSLDGGLRALREGDTLRLTTARAEALPTRILRPGEPLYLEQAGLTICAFESNADGERPPLQKVHKSFDTFCFKKSAICGTMTVRHRMTGDVIHPLGRNCGKSLKKLFIEEKIPRETRACIPVLADEQGVLAVFGLPPGGVMLDVRAAAAGEEEKLWVMWWED